MLINKYKNLIKEDNFILIIIFLINILLLLSTLDNTYTDGWNLRQAQTAIMSRNIFFDNFNIFPTRLNFFAPFEGKVILEFPFIHLLTAISYKFFSVSEINGRILNMFIYLINGILFFKIQKVFFNEKISIIITSLFVSSPLILYTAHAYIPETSMMSFYLLAYYFFAKNTTKYKLINKFLMYISLILSSLAKPLSIIIYFPIFIDSINNNKNIHLKIKNLFLIAISLIPLFLWIIYAKNINSSNLSTGSNWGDWSDIIFGRGGIFKNWIRLDFWRNIIFNFLFLHLNPLTIFMSIVAIKNTIKDKSRPITFHRNWIIGNLIALFVLAGPNRGHPYYQIYFLPPLLFYVGNFLKTNFNLISFKNYLIKFVVILNLILSLSFYIYGSNETLRISNINEFKNVFKKNISISNNIPSEYILYATEGMTSGVYDYYGEAYSKKFNLRKNIIENLKQEINSGAKYLFLINTKYGNTIKKLSEEKAFNNWLKTNQNQIYSSESIILYKLK